MVLIVIFFSKYKIMIYIHTSIDYLFIGGLSFPGDFPSCYCSGANLQIMVLIKVLSISQLKTMHVNMYICIFILNMRTLASITVQSC